jgi:predicted aspartyl protease
MKLEHFTLAIAVALAPMSAAVAEVPITLAPTGHPVIPVQVGGHAPVTFVLDTGADQTVLYRHYADELALPLRAGEQLVGQTGVTDVPGVTIPSLVVDGRAYGALATVALPDRADGARLNGIVGLDIMRGTVADIDFAAGRFALRPATSDPREFLSPAATPIRVRRVAEHHLAFDVQVNGITGTAVLDSGARDTRLNWRFAAAAGYSPGDAALPEAGAIQGATNTPVRSKAIEIRTLAVAGHVVSGLKARAVDLPVFEQFGVADRPALILGFDVLRGARIAIDLARDTVWFDWPARTTQAGDSASRAPIDALVSQPGSSVLAVTNR